MPTVDELQARIVELEKRIEEADDYVVSGIFDHANNVVTLIRKSGETVVLDLSSLEGESIKLSGPKWLGHGSDKPNTNAG